MVCNPDWSTCLTCLVACTKEEARCTLGTSSEQSEGLVLPLVVNLPFSQSCRSRRKWAVSVACVAALATPDRFNSLLTVQVGETANWSCYTTSVDPVDFYYRPEEGASPVPIYANCVPLNDRYNVVSSAGECSEDGGTEHVHSGRLCTSTAL